MGDMTHNGPDGHKTISDGINYVVVLHGELFEVITTVINEKMYAAF